MSYYTERHGLRKPIEQTYFINPNAYGVLLRCCERYYDNIAWKYPKECPDGRGYYELDTFYLSEEMKYEIPTLFVDNSGQIGIPKIRENIFAEEPIIDEYDQYALLDFIEFMAKNIYLKLRT